MASTAALELILSLKGAKDVTDDLRDVGEAGGGIGGAVQEGAKLAGAAILGLGGVLVGATKAAADDQLAQDQLAQALRNNAKDWDGNTGAVEDYITQMQQLGFEDSDLRSSLATLTAATGDLTEAQNLQATAMDLARMPGMDLAKATRLLTKADDESYAALGKLGIQIDKNTSKEDALRIIREKSAGQAETYANSTVGSLERMQNSMGEALESIGAAVLPLVSGPLQKLADWFASPEVQKGITEFAKNVGQFLAGAFGLLQGAINTVLPVLQTIAKFVIDNKEIVFGALAAIITGLVIPAFITWATTMLTVTLPALAATMAPIIAAAAPFIALAGVVAALWLAFENNFLGIRDLVVPVVDAIVQAISRWWTEIQPQAEAAWAAISSTAVNAWNWIQTTIVAGVMALVDAWNSNWGGIRTIVESAWNTISSIVTTAWTIVSGIVTTGLQLLSGDWEGAWTTIQTMLSDVWTKITTEILPNALTMIWTLLTEFVPKLIGVLGEWTGAFFSWVWNDLLPQLPGWLWNVVQAVWTFITENGPTILAKLGEWTQAFLDWVMTDVLPQLPGWLGNIATALWGWITGAAATLGDKLFNEWIPAMWEWITGPGGVVENIGSKLGEIANGIWTWITTTAGDMATKALEIGESLYNGIIDGVAGLGQALWDFISGIATSIWDNIVNFFTGGGDSGAAQPDPAHKAMGGSVSARTPYLVGERGPEMFVPRNSGTIIPNHRLVAGSGAGMGAVNIRNVTINAGPGANGAQLATEFIEEIEYQIANRAYTRNPSLARAG